MGLSMEQWPPRLSLFVPTSFELPVEFRQVWRELMESECHHHPLWEESFVQRLRNCETPEESRFHLGAVWAVNMVVGSYCFPRYVAALAGRAEQDAIRHGLLENAWDESGGKGHTIRSHFWLAVRLAKLLGLNDEEIKRITPLPEARVYTNEHFRQCSEGPFDLALGMICLIEEFTGPEFTLIRDALLESCEAGIGMSQDDFRVGRGEEYFNANIEDDERHREEMPRLVAILLSERGVDLCDTTALTSALEEVRQGIRYSVNLRRDFFDGIARLVREGGTIKYLVR